MYKYESSHFSFLLFFIRYKIYIMHTSHHLFTTSFLLDFLGLKSGHSSLYLKNYLFKSFENLFFAQKPTSIKYLKDDKSAVCGNKCTYRLREWQTARRVLARSALLGSTDEGGSMGVPVSSGSGLRPFLYAEGDYAGTTSCHKHLMCVAHMQRFQNFVITFICCHWWF